MRKFYFLSTLVLALLFCNKSGAQDFSNKGKEFWTCFPQHVPSGTNATLSIWITSDKASSGMVTLTTGTFSAPFNIPANGIQEIQVPHALAHISNAESGIVIQKSIRIKTNPGMPAVVAYVQQWGNARSAATLLLPVNVLGRKYYATSFTQLGAGGGGQVAKSQFQIIATKPNTQVRITPRENGATQPGINIILPQMGDIYQYQSDFDLTGTLIESTGGGGGAGCLPIAVFSGSSNITFGTNSCFGGNSYDPLFQQQYPISTWGKNFGFIPFGDYPSGNPYRVLASEDNTNVYFNGALVATLNEGQIYPSVFTSNPDVLTAPTSITADKPIAVMQYAQRRDCSGSGHGDPDMVILNPIEQNISEITIFTSTQQNINRQWINVLIKTIAAPSFRINGAVPSTPFVPAVNIPGYSYLTHQFNPAVNGSQLLKADSGFNAIAYGFQANNFESYAYSAGTNVKDLYQQIGIVSQYGIDPVPSICVGAPFKFKVSLPYCADSIRWDLSNMPGPPPQPPTMIYTSCFAGPGGPDSITIVNGKTIYWYALPLGYTVNTAGVYNITITTFAPNADGCGNEQQFDFDLNVFDPPVGDFTFTTNNGCSNLPVQFTETTPQVPKTTYSFWWDFGDPASGPSNNSNLRNPTHLFSGPGTFNVRYAAITTPGCLTDTITHQVTLTAAPTANFTFSTPLCINVPIQFTDASTAGVVSWAWTFGDGGTSTSQNPVYTYLAAGTYTVTLIVTTATGCPSIAFSQQITIGDNGTLTLTSAPGSDNQTVCINTPISNITYAVGGGGTGGTVTGLPAGVTGSFAGGVITISGTPTVAGTFNFTVTSTGACTNPSVNGTIIVNDDGTLTLSSAAGTDNQTVCINTPIINITYAVGGGGTGGTVSGLPAGVTGSFAGGVVTITGTPTVAGVFNYTVNTTGPCINPTASGRITVTADGTLTLTSAPGTNNQTVCINNPIVNITYAVGGSGTGGSVSGLPAGVTGSFAGGVITITGTPTVAGVFNYTVSITGPCGIPTASGTIIVNNDGTLTLSSAAGTDNQTVCINTPIINITYAVGGGGTGGTVSGLPAGVTGSFAGGVITITGTPTVAGVFNYTVNTTGPCINPTASGRITVTADGTLTLTSAPGTNNQTVCINNPIVNITYAVGGSGTGGSVSGLPAGVTGSFAGGVITITGTPTVAGVFNYTVSTTGPCGIPTASGTITVDNDGTISLSSAAGTDNQTVCINTPIINITYAVGGGGTGGTVSGLPAGVTGSFAGGVITITGTPTVAGVFNYTVNTTGPCINPTASGRITVTADGTLTLTSAPGTNNQTVCINNPIVNITYAVGGSGTGGSVSGLPAGVTGSFAGGVITITGTPTVAGVFNYTVSTTGPCGIPTASGTITVDNDGTISLSSAAGTDNQTVCINTPIINITYAVGGGGTGGTVSGLPAGVTGSFAGGVITITGTPTVAGVFNYTVNTTGPCINPTASGTITVTADGTLTLTSAPGTNNQTVCINNPIVNITYAVGGSGTGGSVSGLPAGVTGSFAGGVITITGTPTVAGVFNYTVSTTGPCGIPTASGTITVTADGTLTLTSGAGTDNQNACINNPIITITYAVGGSGTGGTVTGLPPGVTASFAGGVITISGSPAAGGVFNYTVNTTGPCVTPTASGTINVTNVATITLTSAPGTDNQTVCINTAITNITYLVGGSGTGATFTGLPAGVSGSFAGGVVTISGTPTVVGTFNYTVNTTGPCGTPSANGTIIVNDNSTLTLSSAPGSNVQTVCINTPIINISYAVGGGGTGASITAGSLPAGVSGVFAGGIFTISGTPTVSGTFNFTVGTAGPCINASLSGTITVTADATLTLTSATGTNNQTVCINTAITDITYAVGGTGTGGTVSGLPAGVTGNYAGGVITISGTPSVSGIFNYTVNTTGPCVTPTATGTITVNDNSTLSLSSAPGSNVQTVCINTAISDIRYTVGGGGTGASITAGALPAGVTGSFSGGIFTISGTPTVSGTFNFTVGTAGPCINAALSGTLTVTPDAVLTMTSAPGTNNQTVCVNNPITNIDYAISGSGTGASITAGSLPAGVNGTFSAGVFTISGTPAASGTFNFTVGSAGPCGNQTLTGTLTVNPDHTMSLSSAASTTNQTVCSDKAITPIAYTIGGGASGATVTGLPAGVSSSISGSTLTISGFPAIAGVYNYSITTTGNSCITSSANGTISVLQTPAITFNAVPGICADVPSFLVTASPASGVFTGTGINAGGLFNPAAAGAGNHIIRYTYTAPNGCSNFMEQTISVYPMPPTNAGPDKFMLEGGQVTLTPNLVTNIPVTYAWSPPQYLNDPFIANTIASPPVDFTYTLTITTDNGCSLSDKVFIKVLKKVEIPNIFSPNGDGIHDTWVVQYLESYPGCTVDIFNRYGQKIFHSDGYPKPWDGTVGGKPVPIGTYYYIINPKNGRSILSGYVDVIR